MQKKFNREFENELVMRRRCQEMLEYQDKLDREVLMGGDDALFYDDDDNMSVRVSRTFDTA